MLFVLILAMLRSYAHERKFLLKMLNVHPSNVTCIYVFSLMLVMLVRLFDPSCKLYVSFIAYYGAQCLFEKLMLIFSFDSCITNKGGVCIQFMFGGCTL
jgi:hypothetical protein